MYCISSKNSETPELLICPDYDKSYKTEVLDKYGISIKDMQKLNYPKNIDSLTLFEEATRNASELISSITIEVLGDLPNLNGNEFVIDPQDLEKDNSEKDVFLTQSWISLGKCFAYRVPAWLKQLQIKRIEIVTKMDSYIFAYYPGGFRNPDTPAKVQIQLGKKIFADIISDIIISYQRYDSKGNVTCFNQENYHELQKCFEQVSL